MSTTTTGETDGSTERGGSDLALYGRAARELWIFWALTIYFGFLTILSTPADVMVAVPLFFGVLTVLSIVMGGKLVTSRVAEYRVQ